MHGCTETQSLMLAAALDYAQRGIPVFPCKAEDKKPLTASGFYDASTDVGMIHTWWTNWPNAMIGIPTGPQSGFFVIDLDVPKERGGPDGREAWKGQQEINGPVDTRTHHTPSGGLHILFRWNPSHPIRNSRGHLPAGIDVRGEGGYIVAPPSRRADGKSYQRINDAPINEAPTWLFGKLLRAKPLSKREDTLVTRWPPGHERYTSAALEAEIEKVTSAPPGQRNNTLNEASFALGTLVAVNVLDEADTRERLREAAVLNGLGENEIDATIESGMSAGRQNPRPLPEGGFQEALAKAPMFEAAKSLPVVSASSLAGRPVRPRQWLVTDIIPNGAVTMMSGDGGAGKSLLAIQLGVAITSDRTWIGCKPERGSVLYLAAEDELDEVHRRLVDVTQAQGIDLANLKDLHILSLAGCDAVIAAPDRKSGRIVSTALWLELEREVIRLKPRLVIFDNLANVFDGNEISRVEVRQFIGILHRCAIDHNLAALLLAHPSLTGIATGTGLSGSTAWNNSVRSRLYLDRPKLESSGDADDAVRVLRVLKNNYGPTGLEIPLRWECGQLRPDGLSSGSPIIDRGAIDAHANDIFLKLTAMFEAQNRTVSVNPGCNYAPKIFAEDPAAKSLSKNQLRSAMNRLLADKKIRVESFGPPSRLRSRILLTATEGDHE